MQSLSKRLETIASLVPDGARVCDVGTDHGYLSAFLKLSGKVNTVIAADINKGPLENAAANFKKFSITDIELRLCDGLSGFKEHEIDTIVIAGMGGEVIAGILKRGESIAKIKTKTIILQPTTSPEILRKYLYKNGFEIIKDIPVFENDKIYSVMQVCYTGKAVEKDEYFFYCGLVDFNMPEGLLYIKKQYNRCLSCKNNLKNVKIKQAEYEYYSNLVKDIQTNYDLGE